MNKGIRKEIIDIIGQWSHRSNNSDFATKDINDRLQDFFIENYPDNPNQLSVVIKRSLIEANNLFTLVCIGGDDFSKEIPKYKFPEQGVWTSKNSYYQFYKSQNYRDTFVRPKTLQEKREERLNELGNNGFLNLKE